MSLIYVLLVLVIFGVVLWLLNTYVPMQPPIKTIINVVAVIVLVLWLITTFLPGIGSVRVPTK